MPFSSFAADAIVLNAAFQLTWMTIMYIINMACTNGSMVDFGWPSGFTVMAVWYLMMGTGAWIHRAVLSSMYIVCGARFMFGWIMRGHLTQEDHRWNHWRNYWTTQGGFFGIKSVPINFFCFYHCQSLTNIFFMAVPLHVAATNPSPVLSAWEHIGIGVWIAGFVIENIADMQLTAWKAANRSRGGVMRDGLWRYSRHPNYFGEFCLWVAYAVMTLPEATPSQAVLLLLLPGVAYFLLGLLHRRMDGRASLPQETRRRVCQVPSRDIAFLSTVATQTPSKLSAST
ncbi:hypothetical protein LEN26_000784 [Aphanomyces euteiches]|nr:hypothetical protein AeMF1_003669 [Aphanomyces euteiches]KAH9162820.1 hypothetical protein LEN26_000784 [Aphanomyces euteiches]KAH9189271.1 hypothetical protein AeNC1_008758 [Aphanomyces euteiches]